jgi:predicted lipoprotein
MPFAKPCSIDVSAILVSVAGLSLAGCQILNSSADNTEIRDFCGFSPSKLTQIFI